MYVCMHAHLYICTKTVSVVYVYMKRVHEYVRLWAYIRVRLGVYVSV